MADIKLAYGGEQTMTVTNLHSLASSATAGWTSDYVDNTSNLYEDILLQVCLDPANTAPANDKAFYIFVYGGNNSSDLSVTGASSSGTPGTQGALTFPNITTTTILLPIAYTMFYGVADTVIKSNPFTIAGCFGGIVPPYWGVALLNYSGAALAASGNTVKWRGIYRTIA